MLIPTDNPRARGEITTYTNRLSKKSRGAPKAVSGDRVVPREAEGAAAGAGSGAPVDFSVSVRTFDTANLLALLVRSYTGFGKKRAFFDQWDLF